MKGQIQIEVDATKTLRFLSRVSDRVKSNTAEAVRRAGVDLQNQAKIIAPVDTGFLRSNITLRTTGTRAEVTSRARYSKYVIGKRYRRGPFRGQTIDYMNQALENQRDNIKREMRRAVKRSIGFGR